MQYSDKRTPDMSLPAVQAESRQWWSEIPMTYDDWGRRANGERFSLTWFDDIDRRFLYGVRLFSEASNPFEALMTGVSGKRVLEVGCGMGFHSEMLARAGAELTSIDLSPTSIAATSRRFKMKNLHADIREMDGECMTFPDASFDVVWSWGVVLASSRTGRMIREIHRVLKPGGEARIMVYHLEGTPAVSVIFTKYLFGYFFGASLDRLLWISTDGYTARFYTKDTFADLLATFFDDVNVRTYGEEGNVVPLPRILRQPILKLIPIGAQRRIAAKHASYLYGVARKNLRSGP